MSDPRIPPRDTITKELEPPADGQYVVRDATQKVFYVLVGKWKRTFMVHGDLNLPGQPTKSIKVSVGDVNDLTTTKARTIGPGYHSEIAQGRHPKSKEMAALVAGSTEPGADDAALERVVTLRTAWERYKESHLIRKGRSPRTIEGSVAPAFIARRRQREFGGRTGGYPRRG